MNSTKSTILILIAIGLFYTFTNPQYQEIKSLKTKEEEYTKVLENATAIAELRDQLSVEYAKVPALEIDRLNKVLPPYVDNVRLALDMDGIASRYGIALKQITVNKPDIQGAFTLPTSAGSSYQSVRVSFGFVASYENFKRFLADIEKSLRILDIETVTFAATENGLYNYQLTVDTYWLGEAITTTSSGTSTGSPIPSGQEI